MGTDHNPVSAEFSNILCVADMNITAALDHCLTELALPEVFIQRAKQMSLVDKHGFLGLRAVTKLEESRAMLYRIYVPTVYEAGVMNYIAELTDLKIGGRGCILAQRIGLHRSVQLSFDMEKLDRLCGRSEKPPNKNEYAMISCIVSRGSGESLAEAVLELGVCVPVISFGNGMGLRDKLGLMRITVPVEKEIIWFIVPRYDANLVERTLILRARLDIPGQGFLYKIFVRAPVINLRVRHGERIHAATMEQVIAAMDEVRGSSDWRRFGSKKHESGGKNKTENRGLFFIGQEEEVETFRRMAMENGARGATLNQLEMRSYITETKGQIMESHSRSLCDIITSPEVEEKILKHAALINLFDSGRTSVLKTFDVELPSVIHRQHP
jgi:hypothetical protein